MPQPMPEQYEWSCARTITCDPLTDSHGLECDRINQEAREEFYADVVRSTPLGDLVAPGTILRTDRLVEDVADAIEAAR